MLHNILPNTITGYVTHSIMGNVVPRQFPKTALFSMLLMGKDVCVCMCGVCMYACVCACVCLHMCIWCVYVCIFPWMCVCVFVVCMCLCIHEFVCMFMNVCVCVSQALHLIKSSCALQQTVKWKHVAVRFSFLWLNLRVGIPREWVNSLCAYVCVCVRESERQK